ncbi:hypothetical protein [Streptomyces sp. NPDC087859]|uniref:hypothetical protein n=1 Tax=Streptomyces sp. NPDC087859 TaxID=3365812 RepID=UPI00381423AF
MMVREGSLADHFRRIAREAGWTVALLPGEALRSWEEMVDECADGYDLDVSEYLNDLSVRDLLQLVADDAKVRSLPEFSWFTAELARIDEGFRTVLANGPLIRTEERRWWRRSFPAAGRGDFVSDVKERYGVELTLVD